MKKWEENKEGIADALKAMWAACEKEDFDGAVEEFATACNLCDDDSDEAAEGNTTEGDDKEGDEGKKGLLLAVFGKPKEK